MRRFGVALAAALLLGGAQQAPPGAQPRAGQTAPARAAAVTIPARVTANGLIAACAQNRDLCMAYVVGSADAFTTALAAAGRPQVFCVSPAVTNQQLAQTSLAYLRARPAEGGLNAALVLLAALRTNYPCRR